MTTKTADPYELADMFLISTNSSIHKGKLVMREPGAMFMAGKFKSLPKLLGEAIAGRLGDVPDGYDKAYGMIISDDWPDDRSKKLGIFQTRLEWNDAPDHLLTEYSVMWLEDFANTYPEYQFAVCLPRGYAPLEGYPLPANVLLYHED